MTRNFCKPRRNVAPSQLFRDYEYIMIIDVPKRQHHIDQMNNPSANTWRIEASSTANDDYDYSTEKNTSKLILEAETLRAQAKAMMAQALAMEQELRESRSKARKSKVKEIDHLIEQWFQKYTEPNSTCTDGTHSKGKEQGDDTGSHVSILSNATTIANRLEEENATLEQVLVVVDRLFERQMEASGQTFFLKNGTADLGTSTQSYVNATEYERLSDILDLLIFAAVVMDKRVNDNTAPDISPNKRWSGRVESAIRARLNELRRTQKVNLDRKLKAEMNKAAKSATGSVEDYVRRNLVGQFLEQTSATNSSSTAVDGAQENVALVPLWVPSVFLPFMHDSHASSLGPEQVKALKDQVLMGSKFYVTSHNSVAGAALFRGNIRGTTGNKENKQHTAFVFEDIQRRLEKIPSLQDQVQLFLLPDPEWKPKDGQEPEPTPVLLALPKETSPDESKITTRLILKLGKVSNEQEKAGIG